MLVSRVNFHFELEIPFGARSSNDQQLIYTILKIYTTLGYIFKVKMFHQEASVETIKLIYTRLYVEILKKN